MSWFKVIKQRTGKEYLSYSSIKYALQDVALFEMYMQGRLKKESDALTFGSAYDCLLFTPDRFNDTFYVLMTLMLSSRLTLRTHVLPPSTRTGRRPN